MPSFSDTLRQLIPGPPTPPADPTDAKPTDGVDDSQAGDSPIDTAPYTPLAPTFASAPAPIVQGDYTTPPGAPRVVELAAPARTLGATRYDLNSSTPAGVLVVPGSSEARRVLVWGVTAVDEDTGLPLFGTFALASTPDVSADYSPLFLAGIVYELTTCDPLYAAYVAADVSVNVWIEPLYQKAHR